MLKQITGAEDHHALIPNRESAIDLIPTPFASDTGQPLQIKLNVPLKTPTQILHDLVTHTVEPVNNQKAMVEFELLQEEDDDESTAGNFRAVAMEADLSPRVGEKTGKKSRKQVQQKDSQQPKRILPRRAASQTK